MNLDELIAKGKANSSEAYRLFGAAPGPGIDIIFTPDLPVAYYYSIKVLTPCGAGFIRVMYNSQGRVSSSTLTRMKKELAEFGLSFSTDWGEVVEIVE